VLFEDESYTNSRTYFWALQSLRIVNDCINSIITAWEMSNTSHILRTGQTEREQTDLDVTKSYLAAIESQIEQLKELIKENSAKQEEIIALRDGVRLILPLLQIFYSPR
jgi:glutaredoxin 2